MKINQLFENDINTDPFTEKFKGIKLWHGSRAFSKKPEVITFNLREKPSDTFLPIHNAINTGTKEKFGLPVRNLLFCRTKATVGYGAIYKVIPIGSNYRLFAVPNMYDLTNSYKITHEEVIEKLEHILWEVLEEAPQDGLNDIRKSVLGIKKEDISTYDELRVFFLNEANKNNINEEGKSIINKHLEPIIKRFEMISNSYVEKCIEIENISTLEEEKGNNTEIMLYAPDNFYAVPRVE